MATDNLHGDAATAAALRRADQRGYIVTHRSRNETRIRKEDWQL